MANVANSFIFGDQVINLIIANKFMGIKINCSIKMYQKSVYVPYYKNYR